MGELKSRGCVTLRDTENRLSCMDSFSTADSLFYEAEGENGSQINSHIPRGTRASYTSLTLHMMEA